MNFIRNFQEHIRYALFEGGKALKDVKGIRTIKQDEVASTIKDIEKNVLDVLKINSTKIGSAGLKPDDQESGDIDFITVSDYETLVDKDRSMFDKKDIKEMKGLKVVSFPWRIAGNDDNGYVQVDLISVSDIDWAKFIYYCPDYRKKESAYKSAHRNWLLSAVLSTKRKNIVMDGDDVVQYDGYSLRLPDGLYAVKKSYKGKTKLLKHADVIDESLFTKDPNKFVEFLFGKDVKPADIKTFEDCYRITKMKYGKHMDDINNKLKEFLDRVDLDIPDEINE